MYNDLSKLEGRIIKEIWANERYLCFVTNKGPLTYEVYGDCCSYSFYHDFVGVKKLLAGNPVISTKEVESQVEPTEEELKAADELACYGMEIVTEDSQFGEVTSVFSFRNDSNGYYGGAIETCTTEPPTPQMLQITDDILDIPSALEVGITNKEQQ